MSHAINIQNNFLKIIPFWHADVSSKSKAFFYLEVPEQQCVIRQRKFSFAACKPDSWLSFRQG